MPDVKITELPVVTSVTGSDVLPVVAGNTTSQISIANLANSIASNGVTGSLLMSGSIIPAVGAGSFTSSFSLGSATNAWKDIYVSNGTINFLNGAGVSQGTLSSTAGGLQLGNSQITGSLFQTPTNRYNTGSTSYFVAEVQAKPSKALSIFNGADGINGDLLAVQNIYSALPFDKTYNAYYIMNNGSTDFHEAYSGSLVLSLPPWMNTRHAPGETITVYNMSTGSELINNGEIYIVSMLQKVDGVGTASGLNGYASRVSSYFNNGALLSGSWSRTGNPLQNYVNINPSYTPATTHSIAIQPGQKATFEVMIFPNSVDTATASYYNGTEYPTTGSYDSTYFGGYEINMGYRFVGIEDL